MNYKKEFQRWNFLRVVITNVKHLKLSRRLLHHISKRHFGINIGEYDEAPLKLNIWVLFKESLKQCIHTTFYFLLVRELHLLLVWEFWKDQEIKCIAFTREFRVSFLFCISTKIRLSFFKKNFRWIKNGQELFIYLSLCKSRNSCYDNYPFDSRQYCPAHSIPLNQYRQSSPQSI